MINAVNKATKLVVNNCLESRIFRIVFRWNKGQKDGINIGAKSTQKFVQIPTVKLKEGRYAVVRTKWNKICGNRRNLYLTS